MTFPKAMSKMDSKLWNPSTCTGTSEYIKRSVGSFSSPKINTQHGNSHHETVVALDNTSLDFDTYKIPIEVQRTMVRNNFNRPQKKKQLFNLNSFFKPNQSFEKKGYCQKQKPVKSYRKLSNSFKKKGNHYWSWNVKAKFESRLTFTLALNLTHGIFCQRRNRQTRIDARVCRNNWPIHHE